MRCVSLKPLRIQEEEDKLNREAGLGQTRTMHAVASKMKMNHWESTQLRGLLEGLQDLEEIKWNEVDKARLLLELHKHRGQTCLSTISKQA